jgi:hypothetical protein
MFHGGFPFEEAKRQGQDHPISFRPTVITRVSDWSHRVVISRRPRAYRDRRHPVFHKTIGAVCGTKNEAGASIENENASTPFRVCQPILWCQERKLRCESILLVAHDQAPSWSIVVAFYLAACATSVCYTSKTIFELILACRAGTTGGSALPDPRVALEKDVDVRRFIPRH